MTASKLGEVRVSWINVLLNPSIFEVASLGRRSALIFCSHGTCFISIVVKRQGRICTLCRYLMNLGSSTKKLNYVMKSSRAWNLMIRLGTYMISCSELKHPQHHPSHQIWLLQNILNIIICFNKDFGILTVRSQFPHRDENG